MKIKPFLSAMALAAALPSHSQNSPCGTTMMPQPMASAIITKPCPNLMSYYPYNPGNVAPLKTIIPLNFIYIKPVGGNGNWDTVTAASGKRVVALLNRMWDSVVPPNLPLPLPYTAPFYTEKKINFVHKATYHIADSAYYHFTGSDAQRLLPDTKAINIFYSVSNHAGQSTAIPSIKLIINGDSADPYAASNMFQSGSVNLLSHEIGHCLGLWHTKQYLDAAGNFHTLQSSNSTGTLTSTLIDDYWVEDPTQWNQGSNGGNNLMSYWWDNSRYLSPKQLAYIHYMLGNHPLLKNVPVAKVVPNTTCTANHNGDIHLNVSGVMSGQLLFPPGDLIIKSGTHAVLNTCLTMRENAKIVIEPGAKLSIIGGGVSTMETCPAQWWGIEVQSNQNAVQSLNYSNPTLPGNGVGMLELNHATLSHARCAVYVSKDAGTVIGNNVPGTGAGIVYSKNSLFLNNEIGMFFDTYFTLGAVTNNLSYSRRDSFVVNSDFKPNFGHASPCYGIRIDKAPGIQVIGNYFSDTEYMTATAIAASDCDVTIVDHCASSGCNGTRMRNRFYGFRMAVDVGNSFNIIPTVIDHCKIEQGGNNPNNTYGSIYMLNSLAPSVINCDVETYFKSIGQPHTYGLYLDNCDAYAVENNNFSSMYAVRTIGAVVNSSGPAANAVYNNTFSGLAQGLWAQHQNYDPVSGSGLLMNCNDFVNGTNYNIGVQGYGGTSATGVAEVQGTADPLIEMFYARNKYTPSSGSCAYNSESKFYINTPNAFLITSHGSFNSAAFQPTSQVNNSCSNPHELINVTGINPASQLKSTYCPSNYLPGFSKEALQSKISMLRESRNNLEMAYYQSLDGGHTQTLLNYVHQSPALLSFSQLRDTLIKKAFLSDTVLKAYFTKNALPKTELQAVFMQNYPLSPQVWSLVSRLDLSEAMLNDWQQHQRENKLSSREELRSQLVMAKNELGIYSNEKVRRFLTDSNGAQYDSLVAHYRLNENAMSQWNLARTFIAANRIQEATALINQLQSDDTSNADACQLLRHTLRLASEEAYADKLRDDSITRAFLLDRARYSLKPIKQGYSRALLKSVYGIAVTPECLYPVQSELGGRMANLSTEVQAVLEETDKILIYPNPASQSLNVRVQKNKGPFLVTITNMEGKVLLSQTCNQDCEIQLQSLINGLYLLHLYKDDQLLNTKKVVVIK